MSNGVHDNTSNGENPDSRTSFSYPSTLSLQSSDTVTSASPLSGGAQHPPQKDYSAALATLQSRYGMGAHVPSPKPDASRKLTGQDLSGASARPSDVTLLSSEGTVRSSQTGDSAARAKKGLVQKLRDKLKRS